MKRGVNRVPAAVIYARVSSKEQEEEGFSIPAQLRLLREYAQKHGLLVEREFTEAETAKVAGRKSFDLMLRYLKEKPGTAILVEKTDRLYRNFADFVKVDELGAILHFVKESQVIRPDSHSSEKLMHSIKVCMAKNYVDNLSEEIRKGMKEKALQGIYPSHAPLGYKNQFVQGKKSIVPDPQRAPIITRLFEEFAAGAISMRGLTSAAEKAGLTTKRGNKLCKSQLHRLIRNEVYIGRVPWNGVVFEGNHEPLVDSDIFFKVQEILSGRTSRRGYGTVPIALRGLVTCSRCGCLLAGEIKKGKYVYYHCCGRQTGCTTPYVREEILVDLFAQELESIAVPIDVIDQIERHLQDRQLNDEQSGMRRRATMRQDVARLQKCLASLYEDKVAGEVSFDTYRTLRLKFETDLAAAEEALRSETTEVTRLDSRRILELFSSAGDRFKQGDSEVKRSLIQILYSNSYFDGETLRLEAKSEYASMLKAAQITNEELALAGCPSGKIEDWWRQGDSNP